MASTAAIHPDEERIVPEMEFQDRLRRSLRVVGLSVGELAYILDVDPNTVGRWLNGRTMPNKATRMILSTLTRVDLGWLETGVASTEAIEATKRARRDSNPKPSDLESRHLQLVPSVSLPLTVNRPVPVARTLSLVEGL